MTDIELLFSRLTSETTGNIGLRRDLGWTEARYDAAKDALVAGGSVVKGQGRGGTLRRVDAGAPAPKPVESEVTEESSDGRPMRSVTTDEYADPVVFVGDKLDVTRVMSVLSQEYRKTEFYTEGDGDDIGIYVRRKVRAYTISPETMDRLRGIAERAALGEAVAV